MADTEQTLVKKIIKGAELPKSIQGDGRYLMTLLNQYLQEMATQVNLANGFSAEEIKPSDGSYPTPRNFFLSFTRTGGQFTWSHIADISDLAYYELRTDTSVGYKARMLDQTTNNYSNVLPVNRTDTVYLYAVSKNGTYSNPSTIPYTKTMPDAPTDIAVTATSEGTLVTFLAIPTDCIGANVYIDGNKYQTLDNVFLVKDVEKIAEIEVAYYDQFGEGERGILYLILPDVTGFLVERNGAELDFYWDAINIYGVKYVVKVGSNPIWEQAIELFRTETNDKNRRLYPNTGEYYLMVKAYDDNGNYSENAAWQILGNDIDIHRNVILEFDQDATMYSGNKINVYYDPAMGGVVLNREATEGEYIFDVQLDQTYRARNWIDYTPLATSLEETIWDDANYAWEDSENPWAGATGNADSTEFKHEIATKTNIDTDSVFSADLNGNLKTYDKADPTKAQNADTFNSGRWAQGLYIDDLTILEYDVPLVTNTFSMVFFFKKNERLNDASMMTLASKDNKSWLRLAYNGRLEQFELIGSDGYVVEVPYKSNDVTDYLTFGISQSDTTRALYLNSLSKGTFSGSVDAGYNGIYTKLYAYSKLIF